MLVIRFMPHAKSRMSTSAESSSPVAHRVQKSMPTERTSGSANGSSMSLALVARALPAATKVAVAPTLDAKSQVSLSVRFNQVPNASGQAHEPSGRVGTIRRCGRC
jgi:hypothetical protein